MGFEDFAGDVTLYRSITRATLFNTQPTLVDITLGTHVLEGLDTATEYYVGLAVAEVSGEKPIPVGQVLSAVTGAPIYANPNATGAAPDGLTPETAFPNVFLAILTATLQGGGNVHVAEGTLLDVSVPLLAGVDLYGGFTPDFDLEARDPETHATVLLGLAGSSVLKLEVGGGDLQRVDGLTIDGGGASDNGVDLDRTPAQLSGLSVRRCSRGIRVRALPGDNMTKVSLIHSTFEQNDLEGLSLEGPFKVKVDDCTFQHNGQEGFEFGPWVAPSGQTVSLTVTDSRFLGNGFEGLDIDLVSSELPGPGGVFVVRIEDCDFELNGGHGCLIDLDYDLHPEWSADLLVRGSQARANTGSGFHFDLDNSSICVMHRLLATANGEDGLTITSETYSAVAVVSASAFVGNLGSGVRTSLGNVGAALSHCIFAGNDRGGLRMEATHSTVVSSAAHLQAAPFGGARTRGSVNLPDAPLPFLYAPIEYRRVLNVVGDELVLDAPLGTALELAGEVASDGVVRSVDAITGAQVAVTPVPTTLPLPTRLVVFPASDSVEEDYSPSLDSGLLGAGMAHPASEEVDAGVFGSPRGGAPGMDDLFPAPLFRVASTVPAWGKPIDSAASFRIKFAGGTPQADTVENGIRMIDASGVAWPVSAVIQGDALVVSPPSGGWAIGDLIELYGTLESRIDGYPLIPVTLTVGAN